MFATSIATLVKAADKEAAKERTLHGNFHYVPTVKNLIYLYSANNETLKMAKLRALVDRTAITDTITRFLRSLDDGNSELLFSCLTDDMVMDLTPLNKATAGGTRFSYSAFQGRANVVEKLMRAAGKTMDSAHHVSNFLVELNDNEAEVSCYALAQHFRLGEGPSHDEHNDYCLMGNRYDVTLVCEKEAWRIKTFVVNSMWSQGNVDVMKVNY